MAGIWLNQLICSWVFYIPCQDFWTINGTIDFDLIKKKRWAFSNPAQGGSLYRWIFFGGIFCSPTRSCEITQRLGWLEPWGWKFMFRYLSCEMLQWKEVSARNSIHIFCHCRRPPSNLANDNMMITVSLVELRTMLMQWASGSWNMRQVYEIWWSKDEWSKNFPCNQSEWNPCTSS